MTPTSDDERTWEPLLGSALDEAEGGGPLYFEPEMDEEDDDEKFPSELQWDSDEDSDKFEETSEEDED